MRHLEFSLQASFECVSEQNWNFIELCAQCDVALPWFGHCHCFFPGYPEPGYSNNLDCRFYVHTSEPGALIEVTVVRMRMEINCRYDRLEVHHGARFIRLPPVYSQSRNITCFSLSRLYKNGPMLRFSCREQFAGLQASGAGSLRVH